ncbi:MAG TPA: polysaccharide deacetylase family protein [Nitrospira sp.]|nr:polysaccharide deacetylase family protein [Nitrospira sp.]
MLARFHGPGIFGLLLLCIIGGLGWLQSRSQPSTHIVKPEDIVIFPGVVGPTDTTRVALAIPTPLDGYVAGQQSRLAVLLTEEKSNWLGLAHGLKTIGVPFLVTRDYREALKHQVILVYPSLTGRSFPPDALRAIGAVPRQGGTLIATQVLGGGLEEVFGFKEIVPAHQSSEVRWDRGHPLLAGMTDPKEWTTRVQSTISEERIAAYGYTEARDALGRYPDGLAAVTVKSYGKGGAYAFGIDLGTLLLKGYNNRADGIMTSFDNRFDPTLDVWLRLLRSMYKTGNPDAVTLGTVPFDKSLSVILTHDVDFSESMANAVAYAEYEHSQGFAATYFIQTKYVRDYNDEVFFDDTGVRHLKRLVELGMELGSHTVAHSNVFNTFPMGTGEERYPAYQPFVKDRRTSLGATILGELRVSRFLVEHFSGQAPMRSFRPGELSYPFGLPQALAATGFRYSSTSTANNSLTHFPYQLTYDRLNESEVPVFEFPVTVEDEELPPLGQRLPEAVQLARQIARYGGSMVVLIHPNILGHKLEFERGFVEAVKDMSWFGSLKQFGDWWAARNEVQVDVERRERRATIRLNAPQPLAGLVLEVPAGWTLLAGADEPNRPVQRNCRILFPELSGNSTLHITVGHAAICDRQAPPDVKEAGPPVMRPAGRAS